MPVASKRLRSACWPAVSPVRGTPYSVIGLKHLHRPLWLAVWLAAAIGLRAEQSPAINPFGQASPAREDATAGYVELSDGSVHPGQIYLTRDKRLQIYDEDLQERREIPLTAVKSVECIVKKEWIEKEWKFKEAANDAKVYTGRTYPAREYLHKITLQGGQAITGPLWAIVYVEPPKSFSAEPGKARDRPEAERFILHQRDKGRLDTGLPSLVYVQSIKLGKDAFEEGLRKAAKRRAGASK